MPISHVTPKSDSSSLRTDRHLLRWSLDRERREHVEAVLVSLRPLENDLVAVPGGIDGAVRLNHLPERARTEGTGQTLVTSASPEPLLDLRRLGGQDVIHDRLRRGEIREETVGPSL